MPYTDWLKRVYELYKAGTGDKLEIRGLHEMLMHLWKVAEYTPLQAAEYLHDAGL